MASIASLFLMAVFLLLTIPQQALSMTSDRVFRGQLDRHLLNTPPFPPKTPPPPPLTFQLPPLRPENPPQPPVKSQLPPLPPKEPPQPSLQSQLPPLPPRKPPQPSLKSQLPPLLPRKPPQPSSKSQLPPLPPKKPPQPSLKSQLPPLPPKKPPQPSFNSQLPPVPYITPFPPPPPIYSTQPVPIPKKPPTPSIAHTPNHEVPPSPEASLHRVIDERSLYSQPLSPKKSTPRGTNGQAPKNLPHGVSSRTSYNTEPPKTSPHHKILSYTPTTGNGRLISGENNGNEPDPGFKAPIPAKVSSFSAVSRP